MALTRREFLALAGASAGAVTIGVVGLAPCNARAIERNNGWRLHARDEIWQCPKPTLWIQDNCRTCGYAEDDIDWDDRFFSSDIRVNNPEAYLDGLCGRDYICRTFIWGPPGYSCEIEENLEFRRRNPLRFVDCPCCGNGRKLRHTAKEYGGTSFFVPLESGHNNRIDFGLDGGRHLAAVPPPIDSAWFGEDLVNGRTYFSRYDTDRTTRDEWIGALEKEAQAWSACLAPLPNRHLFRI